LYDISYLVGAAGYFIALFVLLNIASLFNFTIKQQSDLFAAGVLIMFYACYFGTLGRDCVDRLSDRMALSIGYYSKTGFPKKHLRESMCAICGLNTKDSNQDIRKLACGHAYHFACIKYLNLT
jgi:RING finger protein 121